MGKRLFVSVDLDGLAEEVAAVQDYFEGASGLSFTDPEQAHVTLKFLGDSEVLRTSGSRTQSGDTDPDRVDEVVGELDAAVADADTGPFTAEFGGLGVFPSMDYISVVWLGVREGAAELSRLHETIEPRMVALGFDEETHEFTPHVTLARMEHAGGKDLVQETVRERDPTVGTRRVEEIRLTESVLRSDGPEYSTLERIEL